MMVNNMQGGKSKMADFMPYKDEVEEEEISLEDAMRLWK